LIKVVPPPDRRLAFLEAPLGDDLERKRDLLPLAATAAAAYLLQELVGEFRSEFGGGGGEMARGAPGGHGNGRGRRRGRGPGRGCAGSAVSGRSDPGRSREVMPDDLPGGGHDRNLEGARCGIRRGPDH